MLGGARERIPAYASSETMSKTEDYVEMLAQARADGFRAVKVHGWGDPERDAQLLKDLRDAGPDLVLMHDAEGVYDRRGALYVGRRLEEIGARWYEAPLPDSDLDGYRDLCRKLDVPVLAAGYTVSDAHQLTDALRNPPFAALRADVGISGGITSLCRLAELAAAFNMDLEPVSYGHSLRQFANLHVMLAYENISFLELAYPLEPYEYGVTSPPLRPDADGMVAAPEGVGLGIELDWAWIYEHAASRIVVEA
jgi:L-alanine-DL-glutamate epimerase-like enolase superfamily enzyme